MAFYSKVYAYDRAGVPAEKAVDMAYNRVYQQDDRLKQMISQQVRIKTTSRLEQPQRRIISIAFAVVDQLRGAKHQRRRAG